MGAVGRESRAEHGRGEVAYLQGPQHQSSARPLSAVEGAGREHSDEVVPQLLDVWASKAAEGGQHSWPRVPPLVVLSLGGGSSAGTDIAFVSPLALCGKC